MSSPVRRPTSFPRWDSRCRPGSPDTAQGKVSVPHSCGAELGHHFCILGVDVLRGTPLRHVALHERGNTGTGVLRVLRSPLI